MAIQRLSGGLTPGDGDDPRTFPAIWNDTADLLDDAVIFAGTAVPVDGNVLTFSTAVSGWVAGTVTGGGNASIDSIFLLMGA
jgi:hypothetical protein